MPTLTTTHAVHSMSSSEAARSWPVHLRGVVTYYDPVTGDGTGALFVQDATGAIFIRILQKLDFSLPAGTLIDLRGVSNAGEFAPIVARPHIHVIRFAGLPGNPHHPSLARLKSGVEDGQWVEIEGVIHSIVEQEHHVDLQVVMADGPITVHIVRDAGADYARLVDAAVRIRGNPGPLFDAIRRQMIGVNLHCSGFSAIQVVQPAPEDVFALPVLPVGRLLQWDVARLRAHRMHVAGRVTLQWPGSSVCLTDATGGICAQTDQRLRLVNGEPIDVVGFVGVQASAPVLTDARFRSAETSLAAPIAASVVTPGQVLSGGHESQLIQTDGQLISRDLASADTVLLLSSGKYIFKAILPQRLSSPVAKAWENGSVLRVSGICSVQVDAERSVLGLGTAVPTTFTVLLRSAADVTVVKKASWWTPVHAVVLLTFALWVTLVVLAWVVRLRKRIRESEERFRHLAHHDALTGLSSRLVLGGSLDAALETARRHGSGLALLMVDLDKFKEINDNLGHQAGDEVLQATARRLKNAVRGSDLVVRVGGDEFVVLLTELRDLKVAERIASNLVRDLSAPMAIEGRAVNLSASVGISSAFAGELDADLLLRQADIALYRAKRDDCGGYRVFSPGFDGSSVEEETVGVAGREAQPRNKKGARSVSREPDEVDAPWGDRAEWHRTPGSRDQ